jgi:hypothetical protein
LLADDHAEDLHLSVLSTEPPNGAINAALANCRRSA